MKISKQLVYVFSIGAFLIVGCGGNVKFNEGVGKTLGNIIDQINNGNENDTNSTDSISETQVAEEIKNNTSEDFIRVCEGAPLGGDLCVLVCVDGQETQVALASIARQANGSGELDSILSGTIGSCASADDPSGEDGSSGDGTSSDGSSDDSSSDDSSSDDS